MLHVPLVFGDPHRARTLKKQLNHRQPQPRLPRTVLRHLIPRIRIPRIRMSNHRGARVVPQHPRNALVGFRRAIAHDHHAAVLRVAHAHAAAVMQPHPRRAASHIQYRVEQRPVADCVAAVVKDPDIHRTLTEWIGFTQGYSVTLESQNDTAKQALALIDGELAKER